MLARRSLKHEGLNFFKALGPNAPAICRKQELQRPCRYWPLEGEWWLAAAATCLQGDAGKIRAWCAGWPGGAWTNLHLLLIAAGKTPTNATLYACYTANGYKNILTNITQQICYITHDIHRMYDKLQCSVAQLNFLSQISVIQTCQYGTFFMTSRP